MSVSGSSLLLPGCVLRDQVEVQHLGGGSFRGIERSYPRLVVETENADANFARRAQRMGRGRRVLAGGEIIVGPTEYLAALRLDSRGGGPYAGIYVD